MFYAIFEELCRLRGVPPSRGAEEAGLNRATVTCWKKEGFCPRQATLTRLAAFFAVPAAYLREEPVWPCPVCGGDAAAHAQRHPRLLRAAAQYGFCWPEPLCRQELDRAREQLLEETLTREETIAAVRRVLRAHFSRSLQALDFPPDHPAPAAYAGLALARLPLEDWVEEEIAAYLREAYPPPAAADGLYRLPAALFPEEPPAPPASLSPLPPATGYVPVVGFIAAGHPILVREDITGYVAWDRPHPEQYMALRVKGDSMVGAGIPDGALVVVHRQTEAADGQIAACLLDGEDVTLKRIRRDGDHIILWPENPAYAPLIVPSAAFANGSARILGVAVEVRIGL